MHAHARGSEACSGGMHTRVLALAYRGLRERANARTHIAEYTDRLRVHALAYTRTHGDAHVQARASMCGAEPTSTCMLARVRR
eukprot:6180192-Pleurochrysis_carterae.AAC.3